MTLQIPLKFEPQVDFAAADFLASAANRAALSLINSWPDWPQPSAAIWGPVGAGKSHLGHIWAARTGATYTEGEDIQSFCIDAIGTTPSLVLDFGQESAPAIDERKLFHLLNIMRETGGALLLIARSAPSRWLITLPDLASRLKALPNAEVQAPDDGLFAAVLSKQFADRQLVVEKDTIDYIVMRGERSFAAARHIVARIDQAALAQRRPIGKRLAGEVLAEIADEP